MNNDLEPDYSDKLDSIVSTLMEATENDKEKAKKLIENISESENSDIKEVWTSLVWFELRREFRDAMSEGSLKRIRLGDVYAIDDAKDIKRSVKNRMYKRVKEY